MTSGESALSQLIGQIYDAALDPALWPDVLERICGFVGGSIANLYIHDANRQGAALLYSHGQDPQYLQLYLEKYVRMNPMYPASSFIEVGKIIDGSDLVPRDEFLESRFYTCQQPGWRIGMQRHASDNFRTIQAVAKDVCRDREQAAWSNAGSAERAFGGSADAGARIHPPP